MTLAMLEQLGRGGDQSHDFERFTIPGAQNFRAQNYAIRTGRFERQLFLRGGGFNRWTGARQKPGQKTLCKATFTLSMC